MEMADLKGPPYDNEGSADLQVRRNEQAGLKARTTIVARVMARNYGRLVQQLRSERSALEREVERLTQAISALEGGSGGPGRRKGGARKAAAGGRRRRRKMSAANRRAVSLRMKKYWAARRKQAA